MDFVFLIVAIKKIISNTRYTAVAKLTVQSLIEDVIPACVVSVLLPYIIVCVQQNTFCDVSDV